MRKAPSSRTEMFYCVLHTLMDGDRSHEPAETAPLVVAMKYCGRRFKCKYPSKELSWSALLFLDSIQNEVGRKGEMPPSSLYLRRASTYTVIAGGGKHFFGGHGIQPSKGHSFHTLWLPPHFRGIFLMCVYTIK